MMRRREFLLWFCTALWHGIVIFFGWVTVLNMVAKDVIMRTTFSSCSGVRRQEVLVCPATSPTPSSSTSSASASAPTRRPSCLSTSSCGSRQVYILEVELYWQHLLLNVTSFLLGLIRIVCFGYLHVSFNRLVHGGLA